MQATYVQEGESIDYTPVAAVAAGAVVLVGTVPLIAILDIAAGALGALATQGVFDVAKVTGAISAGDAVFWSATADPVGGTAGTGAASTTASGTYRLGYATAAAGSSDTTVRVRLGVGTRQTTMPRIPTTTVAATGSTQADAAAIAEGFTLVTAADATKGVLLPSAVAGMQVIVKNGAAAVLKIWPSTSDGINAVAVNSAFSIASLTSVLLVAYDATTWYSVPLLPS